MSPFKKPPPGLLEVLDLPNDLLVYRLGPYDLQRLRLVCVKTRRWVDKHYNFHEKCIIQFDTLAHLKQLHIPIKVNRYYPQIQEPLEYQAFLKRYGRYIRHLKLNHSEQVQYLTRNLFRFCPKLTSLDLIGEWPLKDFIHNPNWPNRVLKKVRALSISTEPIVCDSPAPVQNEKSDQFLTFLKQFRNLDFLQINSHPDSDNRTLHKQVISYLKLRSGKLANILSQSDGQTSNNFLFDYESCFTADKFCAIVQLVQYDLHGMDNDEDLTTFEEFLSRVKTFSTSDCILTMAYRKQISFPFQAFKNVQDLRIHFAKFNLTELADVTQQGANANTLFSSLRNLHLLMTPDVKHEDFQTVKNIFASGNNKINMIGLEFCQGLNADFHIEVERRLVDFLKSFDRLRHLSLKNECYGLEWVAELNNLEKLDLSGFMAVSDEDFIGPEDNDEDPWFCKLTRLTHLSIATVEPEWTNRVFQKVFSRMGLQSFSIKDNLRISKDGIESLANGPFAETIEYFPYPWITDKTNELADSHISPGYTQGSEVPEIFSQTEFLEFKENNFKLFERNVQTETRRKRTIDCSKCSCLIM